MIRQFPSFFMSFSNTELRQIHITTTNIIPKNFRQIFFPDVKEAFNVRFELIRLEFIYLTSIKTNNLKLFTLY